MEGSCVDLLADELRADGGRGIAEDHRLGAHQPVLGATERERVDAGVDRERPQRRRRAAERGGGVGEPGAVEVDQHSHAVGLVAQRGDLVGGVERAELGRLGDRDARPGWTWC